MNEIYSIDGTLMWATKVHDYGHSDYSIGHRVHIIEIFATIFTLSAWRCWYYLLDPVLNSAGWGYEKVYYNYCKPKFPDFDMGVLDSMVAKHHKSLGKVIQKFKPDGANKLTPRQQLDSWLYISQQRRNTTLKNAHHTYFGPRLE